MVVGNSWTTEWSFILRRFQTRVPAFVNPGVKRVNVLSR